MLEIRARNVNFMLRRVMQELNLEGLTDSSRNGPVLRFSEPVSLRYDRPYERVLFCQTRDANPFFHFMEAMWMLAGRRDVAFLTRYNQQMAQYSDDGVTFNAAYGYRLRHHFGMDQLALIVEELREKKDSRQCVAQLWDPNDLGKVTKDKACNLCMLFSLMDNHLNLTVFNRSNDAILGATGANQVHMSYFQQYVADSLGVQMGYYEQVSNNLHVYTEHSKTKPQMDLRFSDPNDCYHNGKVAPPPRMVDILREDWDRELIHLCDVISFSTPEDDYIVPEGFNSKFIPDVVIPIHNAWMARKKNDPGKMRMWLSLIGDTAWAHACTLWVNQRRIK